MILKCAEQHCVKCMRCRVKWIVCGHRSHRCTASTSPVIRCFFFLQVSLVHIIDKSIFINVSGYFIVYTALISIIKREHFSNGNRSKMRVTTIFIATRTTSSRPNVNYSALLIPQIVDLILFRQEGKFSFVFHFKSFFFPLSLSKVSDTLSFSVFRSSNSFALNCSLVVRTVKNNFFWIRFNSNHSDLIGLCFCSIKSPVHWTIEYD